MINKNYNNKQKLIYKNDFKINYFKNVLYQNDNAIN